MAFSLGSFLKFFIFHLLFFTLGPFSLPVILFFGGWPLAQNLNFIGFNGVVVFQYLIFLSFNGILWLSLYFGNIGGLSVNNKLAELGA